MAPPHLSLPPNPPLPVSGWFSHCNERRWEFESQICCLMGESFLLSGPQFSHLYNGKAGLDDL